MPVVSVPGQGDVEFPDSMTDEDIAAVIKGMPQVQVGDAQPVAADAGATRRVLMAVPQPDQSDQPTTNEEPVGALEAAYATSMRLAPKRAAEAMDLGRRTGFSPQWLAEPGNLEAVKPDADRQQSTTQLKNSPLLASYMQDPAKAAVAQDDVPALSALEAGFADIARSVLSRKYMADPLDEENRIFLENVEEALAKYDREEHGLLAQTARFLPTIGAYVAAGAAGLRLAGPGGAVAGPWALMYQLHVGELYRQIQQRELALIEADPNYEPTPDKQQREYAKKGAITAATVFTALGGVFAGAVPGANAALQKLGINILAKAGGDTLVKAAVSRLMEIGEHGLSGALAMAVAAATDDATVRKATTGVINVPEATAAGIEAFKAAIGPTLLLSSIEPGRAYLRDRGRILDAKVEAARLDKMAQDAKESKLLQRAPEEAEQLIASMAQDGDAHTVYVAAEALAKEEAERGMGIGVLAPGERMPPGTAPPATGDPRGMGVPGPAEAIAEVVGPHAVAEALATGGEVAIPVEKYLVQLGEHHDALREHVKLSPDGFTLKHVAEWQEAWHGTPHQFAEFDLSKVGTGQGAQSYGHGLYFAQAKVVGERYQKEGFLHRVAVPESAALLDYDKSLSAQAPQIQEMARQALERSGAMENATSPERLGGMTGKDVYEILASYSTGTYPNSRSPGQAREHASRLLLDAGIPGLQYLDQASRAKGEGTHNFVIWDNRAVRMLQPGEAPTPRAAVLRDLAVGVVEGKRLGEIQPGRYEEAARRAADKLAAVAKEAAGEAVRGAGDISQGTGLLAASDVEGVGTAATRAGTRRVRSAAADLEATKALEGARDFSRALAKKAAEVREEAEKSRKFLLSFTTQEGRAELGKAGGDYQGQMDRLLAGLELGNGVSRAEVGRRLATINWIAAEQAEGREPVIPDSVLANLDRVVHANELTPQEMRDLRAAAESIVRQAELKNTILADRKRVDAAHAREEAVKSAFANVKEIAIHQAGDVLTVGERAGALARGAEGVVLKAEELVRRLDGDMVGGMPNINGPFGRFYWHPLSESYNRFLSLEQKWTRPIVDAISAIPAKTRRAWKADRFTVAGSTRTMEQAIGVALNSGNASNDFKLLEGLRKAKTLGLANWTPATVEAFRSRVPRQGWDFAQSVWDAFEAAWPEIAAHEKSLTGIEPPSVRPMGFDLWFDKGGKQVSPGTEGAEKVHYRGGYYPVIYEQQFGFLGKGGRTGDALFHENYRTATTPQGRLNARIESYARPIDLTLDGLPRVIREFAKDTAMREAVLSAHQFITHPDVANALNRTVGEANARVLKSVVLDAANDLVLPANGAEAAVELFSKVRGGVYSAVFSWNIAQTTQNLASLTQVLKHVPTQYVREATRALALEPLKSIAFARASSGEMETRANHINADMAQAVRSVRAGSVATSHLQSAMAPAEWVAELGLKVFQSTDSIVAHTAWRAAYEHGIAPAEKGGLGYDHEAASRHAERVVRLAIGSGRTIDLPAFLRHPVLKLMAPFQGWSSTMFNDFLASNYNGRELWGQGDRKKALMEWSGALVAAAALGISSSLLVFKGPKDREGDGLDLGDVGRWLGVEGILGPVQWTPYIGGALKSVAEGERLRFGLFAPVVARPFEQATNAVAGLSSKMQGDDPLDKDDFETFGLRGLEALATAKGLPVIQARNTLGYWNDENSPKDTLLQEVLGTAAGKDRSGKLLNLAR